MSKKKKKSVESASPRGSTWALFFWKGVLGLAAVFTRPREQVASTGEAKPKKKTENKSQRKKEKSRKGAATDKKPTVQGNSLTPDEEMAELLGL